MQKKNPLHQLDLEFDPDKPHRIAKIIARSGHCSRRDAEKLIEEGRVKVNDEAVISPALNITGSQIITIDGKILPAPQKMRLWRYYKPTGLVTTARDEQGRPTVFDQLPPDMPRVISVGRLDLNSEGLLLLTNDGELARMLELPETGWTRRYRVRVHGKVDADKLAALKNGIIIERIRYDSIDATIEKQQGTNAWLIVSLKEGKNREIRRVMEHIGYQVNRLIRLSYGPFSLGQLTRGQVEEVSPGILRNQLGHAHKGAKAKPKKKGPPINKDWAKRKSEKKSGPLRKKTKRPSASKPSPRHSENPKGRS